MQIRERDYALLRGLFESRIMTARHITSLYFEGRPEAAKKRLQKLKSAGFIAERTRNVNQPAILSLSRKSFNLLYGEGRLSDYPRISANSFLDRANVSERTLQHELDIMDIKAAFHSQIAQYATHSIVEFSTWPLLYEFEAPHPTEGTDILVKPDGFIRIHEQEAGTKGFYHDCFLEVDRSSEVLDTLAWKALSYRHYYNSGGFAIRNQVSRTEFEDFPFRVLMVLKSAERRNNIAERLTQINPPILTQTWLTTFKEIADNPFGAIWILPCDYRRVTKDTAFYNERPTRRFEYRRNQEREVFIDSKIRKLQLFKDSASA